MEKITLTGKAWKAGTDTLVLGIPKNIQNFYNIEIGDLLTFSIENIHKANESKQARKEEKEKQENKTPNTFKPQTTEKEVKETTETKKRFGIK